MELIRDIDAEDSTLQADDAIVNEAQTLHELEMEIADAESTFSLLDRRASGPQSRLTTEVELMAHEQRVARLVTMAAAMRRELEHSEDTALAEEGERIHTLAYLTWLDVHASFAEGRLRRRHRGELAPIKRNLERVVQSAPVPYPRMASRLRETLQRIEETLPLLDACLAKETEQLLSRMRLSKDEVGDKFLLFPALGAAALLPPALASEVRALHSQVTIAEWSSLCEEASRLIDTQPIPRINAQSLLLVLRLLEETPVRLEFHDAKMVEPLLGLQQRIGTLATALAKALAP
jgi:hypothetical protein